MSQESPPFEIEGEVTFKMETEDEFEMDMDEAFDHDSDEEFKPESEDEVKMESDEQLSDEESDMESEEAFEEIEGQVKNTDTTAADVVKQVTDNDLFMFIARSSTSNPTRKKALRKSLINTRRKFQCAYNFTLKNSQDFIFGRSSNTAFEPTTVIVCDLHKAMDDARKRNQTLKSCNRTR